MTSSPQRSRGRRPRHSSAEMFATATSAPRQRARPARRRAERRARRRSRAAFRAVASTACGSWSTRDAPARSRASPPRSRARPSRSRRRAGSPRSSSPSSSRQSRVVGCAPVPNARPGSMTIAIAPAGGCSHGGPTQSGPTRTGRWKSRQRSSQSPGTSSAATAPKARAQQPSSPRVVGVGRRARARRGCSTSSKPSGKSSSILARAASAARRRTVTDDAPEPLSGTRSSASRRTPRRRS